MGQGVPAKKAGPFDIAFGIDQHYQVFPIHVDFLLDGFEEVNKTMTMTSIW